MWWRNTTVISTKGRLSDTLGVFPLGAPSKLKGPGFEHACAYTLYTTRDIRVHTKRRLHVSQLPNLNWYETRFVVGPIIGLKKIELISGSTLHVKSSSILN